MERETEIGGKRDSKIGEREKESVRDRGEESEREREREIEIYMSGERKVHKPSSSAHGRSESDRSDRPDYMTFDYTLDSWHEFFVFHAVDKNAQWALMLLAQRGSQGREEAIKVMDKVMHKAYDGVLNNASAFVHKYAINAKKNMEWKWGDHE